MILIITGPSGVGKNTIIDALGKKLDFNFSVSHTTRPKRVSEVNGKDYYFISDDEFQSMINNNELIEFEEYGGYSCGTSSYPPVRKATWWILAVGHFLSLSSIVAYVNVSPFKPKLMFASLVLTFQDGSGEIG